MISPDELRNPEQGLELRTRPAGCALHYPSPNVECERCAVLARIAARLARAYAQEPPNG